MDYEGCAVSSMAKLGKPRLMAHKLYIAGPTDVEPEVTHRALRSSTSQLREVLADPGGQSHGGARNYALEEKNTLSVAPSRGSTHTSGDYGHGRRGRRSASPLEPPDGNKVKGRRMNAK